MLLCTANCWGLADAIDELGRVTQSLIRTHRLVEEMYVNAFGPDRMVLEHEDGRPEDLPGRAETKGGKR